jgi:hypothetical protein
MAKKTTKMGKALERHVADAYRAIGARKVEHDVELAGHQIDVYVEMETADRALHRIAVEAKDYSKAVGIKIVRDFAAVVNTLRRLKLVDEGVIVSSSGFSRQARNAAKEHSLRLLEPADLEAMAGRPDLAQMREEWAEAEQRFLAHVIEQHRILSLFITQLYGGKVPPMAELEKVFVCLNLAEERRGEVGVEVERLIEEAAIAGEGPLTEFERRVGRVARPQEPTVELASVGEAMGRHQRLLVRGAPGCGKTTLLRYVALKYARGQAAEELGLAETRLPIYLPLRDFGLFLDKRSGDYGPPGPTALADFIAWYFQQAGLALPEGFFIRALKAKRVVVLLDGLDEVPDPALRTKVAQMTTAFMDHYRDNRYVLASRPRGYAEVATALPGLAISDVEELSLEQIEEFVHNLYRIIERHGREDEAEAERQATARADEILKAIKSNPGIRSLARNPLHLSVIVLVHKYRGATLPERRVDVYRESIALLLGHWDVRRQVEDPLQLATYNGTDMVYRDVETAVEEKQALLAPLALWMHEQRKRVVEEKLIVDELAARFKEDDDLPLRKARGQAKAFLAAAHDRSGILVEGNPRFYNFSHQGFQEYLAAWELVSGDDYIERALAHLYDSWWEEVILLAAAQLPPRRATPLLEAILIAGHDDPQQKALDEVLHRNLFLVARCLADIPHRRVAGKLRRKVIDRLVDMAYRPPLCTAQRKDALQLLVQMRYDPGAEVGLLELLRYGAMDPETRRATAEALTRGPGDADARAVGLLRMAQDREIELWARQAAAGLLARIGCTEEAAIAWLALVEDGAVYTWERRRAAEALGQLGKASEAVVSRLLSLAEDGSVDGWVRGWAAEALGQLRAADATMVSSLLALAKVKRPVEALRIYPGDSWENWLRNTAYRALQQLLRSESQLME